VTLFSKSVVNDLFQVDKDAVLLNIRTDTVWILGRSNHGEHFTTPGWLKRNPWKWKRILQLEGLHYIRTLLNPKIDIPRIPDASFLPTSVQCVASGMKSMTPEMIQIIGTLLQKQLNFDVFVMKELS
jgi:hypothetical protein